MALFPIRSGNFALPANVARFLTSITVTATTAPSSVSIIAPDGITVIYTVTMSAIGSATLSLLNHPELEPGMYTVVVTGNVNGTATIGTQ